MELRRYRSVDGRVPYSQWAAYLDNSSSGRVSAHVDRMQSGHFGNSRPVGHGVTELKINFGPGYRVYYLRDGNTAVVLLCGGDKSSQKADIRRAYQYAEDYWKRQ